MLEHQRCQLSAPAVVAEMAPKLIAEVVAPAAALLLLLLLLLELLLLVLQMLAKLLLLLVLPAALALLNALLPHSPSQEVYFVGPWLDRERLSC